MNKLCSIKFLNFSGQLLQRTFSSDKYIIKRQDNKIICDLQMLEEPGSLIESLVIVNNQLNQEWLQKGIDSCQNIVLADGGANRFYDSPFRENPKVRALVGDFDSLKTDVRTFYEERGVELQKIWNQDTNDFEKAIKKSVRRGWNKIFCFGAFGGRMDHTLGSMHHSCKLCKQHEDLDIVLFGKTNLMYFIRPNILNVIKISNKIQKTGCGLIPFGVAENVKTKGFRWNLGPEESHQTLEWGHFISTSNQIDGDTIKVQTSHPIFFVAHFS